MTRCGGVIALLNAIFWSLSRRLMCFTVGRSMEEEARLILREAVDSKAGPENLATAIRDRFAPFAGVGPNRSLRSGRRPYKYPMGPLRSSVQDYSFG